MTATILNSIIAMVIAEHTRMEELQLIQSSVSIKKGRTKVSVEKKVRTNTTATTKNGY